MTRQEALDFLKQLQDNGGATTQVDKEKAKEAIRLLANGWNIPS